MFLTQNVTAEILSIFIAMHNFQPRPFRAEKVGLCDGASAQKAANARPGWGEVGLVYVSMDPISCSHLSIEF
jgi:hypothetical protein